MKANVYEKGRVLDVAQLNERSNPVSQKAIVPARKGSAEWLVIAGLLVLSFIPLISGALRLTQLAGGPEIMPAAPRFTASPLPVVLHIVGAAVFSLLGAFQFSTGFLRSSRPWHRAAGKLVIACGLVVGLSALWMTLFYPRAEGTGDLLFVFRLLFGSGMVLSIVLGYSAVRRGEVKRHRAWMTRAYALGLGAGTQVLTLMVGELVSGPPNELSHALLMGAAWVINLAVAEWVIRKRPARRASLASAVVSLPQ